MRKHTKVFLASLMALTLVFPAAIPSALPLTVSAEETVHPNMLGESTFETKALPWETIENAPAKQRFDLDEGAAHVRIIYPEGSEKTNTDLQFCHKNLSFKKGHTYRISCDIRSNRSGLEIRSEICDPTGTLQWCSLKQDEFGDGPHVVNKLPDEGDPETENPAGWGNVSKLTTKYQTFSGTWTPKEDYENAVWQFRYANDYLGYGGNAREGDEIWFDNMKIECLTCDDCGYTGDSSDDKKEDIRPNLLGEGSFDYKMIPWQLIEATPARQNFNLEDGALHVNILVPEGEEKSKWDLQLRHRNLSFKKDHTYRISCDIKSARSDLEISSQITDAAGQKYYCTLKDDEFGMGPHVGDQEETVNPAGWGNVSLLTTEYRTFSGEWTPTMDYDNLVWSFHYAKDSNGYGGNAYQGDEIWFDNMKIECLTCDDCVYTGDPNFGYVSRKTSGLENNFISVNQLGYYSQLTKNATLSDNKGDIVPGAESIELKKGAVYDYELVKAENDEVVFAGKTGKAFADGDSGDLVAKIDFSAYQTPGTYYLRIKDKAWRSFEFQISNSVYSDKYGKEHDLLTNALNYFYQSRSGMPIVQEYVTSGDKEKLAHQGGHAEDKAYVQNRWRNEYLVPDEASITYASSLADVTGGWYGSLEHAKYMNEGGTAVWTLQNMYERALGTPDGKKKFADGSGTVCVPEDENGIPDILDECRYELNFMASMKVEADEPTWGQYAGLYYQKVCDTKWVGLAVRPWEYEDAWNTVRIVKPPTFAATLNYAACAAQGARLWKEYDPDYAEYLLNTAKEAYAMFQKYYYDPDSNEEANGVSLYGPSNQVKSSEAYGDIDMSDEAYWAASELFITTSLAGDADAERYYTDLTGYDKAFQMEDRIADSDPKYDYDAQNSYTLFRWNSMQAAGDMSLLLHNDLLTETEAKRLKESVKATADSYLAAEEKQGFGIPYKYDGTGVDVSGQGYAIITGYEEGSNARVLNNMMAMAYAYDLTDDSSYLNGVITGMDYLLGNNPLAFSYITGYGDYAVQNPSHRYWANELDQAFPAAPDGVVVGGPNANMYDNFMRSIGFDRFSMDYASQRCYGDSVEAYSVNQNHLQWNASLAWIVSFLQENGNAEADVFTVPGDASGDGETNVADAVMMVNYLTNGGKLKAPKSADMNEDGKLNAIDLTLLKREIMDADKETDKKADK